MSSIIGMYEDDPLWELANEYGDTKATREDYEEGNFYEYYDDEEYEYELTYADEVEDGYDGY